jgi:GGDEF domain-containing protein
VGDRTSGRNQYDLFRHIAGNDFAGGARREGINGVEVILPDLARREEAETVARKIIAAVAAPFQLGSQKQSVDIGTSIGGVPAIAEKTRLNTTTLYRTLSAKGNPELKSFMQIMKAVGMRILVEPLGPVRR